MKFLTEYRDPELAQRYLEEIKKTVTRPWTIMEVCGGQTHSLVKNGILNMLPRSDSGLDLFSQETWIKIAGVGMGRYPVPLEKHLKTGISPSHLRPFIYGKT